LITGESGSGKGLLTKFVHSNGIRHNKPFISINFATLQEIFLEAELFGYKKGAFTGASDTGKAGLFELTNNGTIFLDEIGDLPVSVQAKVLKCLDDGEIRRFGGTEAIKVDCIVIATTNHNLEELDRQKKVRQDLYFRLNIFPIEILPLRQKREDIHELSIFYLRKYNLIYKQTKRVSETGLETLQTYDFPGNVAKTDDEIVTLTLNDFKRIMPEADIDEYILDTKVPRFPIDELELSPEYYLKPLPQLQKPVGNIPFCGDYTRGQSFLVGAALSAFRVARELGSNYVVSEEDELVFPKIPKWGTSGWVTMICNILLIA